ncbi:hypothetical protein Q5P01_025093 [Channa striata]|uniref:DAN domain-containing protein n=1 Tax=Channa striata TaxID=64152 RepID=A0AA88LPD7_CHASR|nr:hypothetical protein Q5P01_025093 [Channa striata]
MGLSVDRVKVLQLVPHTLAYSGLYRRALSPGRAFSFSSRPPFPSVLSETRPGPALTPRNPLHHLYLKSRTETEFKKTQDGSETVTLHNKLCFCQCSSLSVPPGFRAPAGVLHRRAPCSHRTASKARTVTVPLRCGGEVRESEQWW